MGRGVFPWKHHIVGIMGAMVSALLCAASASGATIKWTGGGDGTTWANGDNWGGTAPGAEDEARLETPTSAIQIGSETTVSNITAATTGSANVQLSVSANLNVAGAAKFATQSGATASIDQSAGKATIGGQLTLGGANANTVEWDVHGNGAEMEVNKVFAVTYRGNAACGLTVRDGATLNVTGTVDLGHEGANATTPAGTAYLKVLDGATATIADFAFTGTGYGVVDVSNATLTVTGAIRGNGGARAADGLERSTFSVWKGGKVIANEITFCQYQAHHEQMVQWEGSEVETGLIKISGYGQGGTGTASDILYVVNGGKLTVSGNVTVGNNGQGEFHANGGLININGTAIYVECVPDIYTTDSETGERTLTTQYAPSKLRIAGDAVFNAASADLKMNRSSDWGWREGRVALELQGGNFDATVKSLDWKAVANNPHQSIIAIVDSTGLTGLKVLNNVAFNSPLTVEPSALEGAQYGTYTILSWGGTATGLENITLQTEDTDNWKLNVRASERRIDITYQPKGLTIVVR